MHLFECCPIEALEVVTDNRVIARKTCPILRHLFHVDQFFGHNFWVLATNYSRFIG